MISTSPQQLRTRWEKTWTSGGLKTLAANTWAMFWMRFASLSYPGRFATWVATWFAPPYKARRHLARYNAQGYVAPSANIYHPQLLRGAHVFIGDRATIYQANDGGTVKLGDRVHLHNDTCIETGVGGSLKIGADTHIQPRCQFSAYKAVIEIGANVQIAPNCAFYSYAHSVALGELIQKQPLQTKGGIYIADDAWIGCGAIVLDGVRIGKGAVIGAGAVVTRDIPDNAIAAGVPARTLSMRSN
ncbi:acyltransferase [Aliterella atlantica]|nr:acyltransferase [Aliterella atlantica]